MIGNECPKYGKSCFPESDNECIGCFLRPPDNRKGTECPYKPILCQEGYCSGCSIWVQRQRTKCVKYGSSCFPESDDSCNGCPDQLAHLLTDLANKIVHLNRLEKELTGQKRNPDKDPVGMADELEHPELAELNRKFHKIVGGL